MEQRPASDLADRLTRCFQEVFTNLTAQQARSASVAEIDEWDSLASLSLVAVVEDEFDVALPDEVVADLTDYSLILEALVALQARA